MLAPCSSGGLSLQSSGCSLSHGQGLVAAHVQVLHANQISGDLEPRKQPEQLAADRPKLPAGEVRTDTEVGAITTESKVIVGPTPDVELVGTLEDEIEDLRARDS